MAHKVDMVMDFQYGSTGKGLISGYLAKRGDYDTSICSFAVNAGHSYKDKSRFGDETIMTQQIPTGALSSPTVKQVLIGPGSLIHAPTLLDEIKKYGHLLQGKQILIHPHAAVIEEYHTEQEVQWGMAKIGSTVHGVGAAAIERIKRNPINPNVAGVRWIGTELEQHVVTCEQYRAALNRAESILVEGAQGFSLSIYHGQYPYTTSRDVTPWQISADCGLPYRWASYVKVIGSMRCFPIRVNNRTGSSGPCYPDQEEISFDDLGVEPEITTVTKLKRRIFTFSRQQAEEAAFHCGGYWDTRVFLNFANYTQDEDQLQTIIDKVQAVSGINGNPPNVAWLGFGPDDKDVTTMGEFDETTGA